jgi:SAM-dependent methyltransferase
MICEKCGTKRRDLHTFTGYNGVAIGYCPEHCVMKMFGIMCGKYHPEGVSDVPEPILDTNYWKIRLQEAPPGELHQAIFRCPKEKWDAIAERHRQILKEHIKPTDSILDTGCGWGRLLDLLPVEWQLKSIDRMQYLGVDISPDFIALARERHSKTGRLFVVGDLRDLWKLTDRQYDLAILISIRPMVIRNLGQPVWNEMESQIRKKVERLLYLEYDPQDKGSME